MAVGGCWTWGSPAGKLVCPRGPGEGWPCARGAVDTAIRSVVHLFCCRLSTEHLLCIGSGSGTGNVRESEAHLLPPRTQEHGIMWVSHEGPFWTNFREMVLTAGIQSLHCPRCPQLATESPTASAHRTQLHSVRPLLGHQEQVCRPCRRIRPFCCRPVLCPTQHSCPVGCTGSLGCVTSYFHGLWHVIPPLPWFPYA